ncbi:hypothetical protein BG621_01420 [Parasaccharibacter apium]|nr:hypothetical protein BG621_01420 [Parasaccharibacter apium]
MSGNERWERFWIGFKTLQSYQRAMGGARVAMTFGGAFLVVCLGVYPTYNVLVVDKDNALSCRLASMAHDYYARIGGCLVFGVSLAIISFIIGIGEKENFRQGTVNCCLAGILYLSLVVSVAFYMWAIRDMAEFIGHSTQSVIMTLKTPYDGYICPPLRAPDK